MNNIKVPQEIQIGAHKYKIAFNEMVEKDGHDATTNHNLHEVWFKKESIQSRLIEVFLHEMLHIINRIYCVVHLEERDIELLAEGLTQLLVSNLGINLDWSDIDEIIPTVVKK